MRRYIFNLILALVLISLGFVLTIFEIFNLDIVNDFASDKLNYKTTTYELVAKDKKVNVVTPLANLYDVKYDNTLAKGNYKIEVTYASALINVDKEEHLYDISEYIYITLRYNHDAETVKKLFDVTIDNLKNDKVINYYKAVTPKVTLIINEEDKDNIKIGE